MFVCYEGELEIGRTYDNGSIWDCYGVEHKIPIYILRKATYEEYLDQELNGPNPERTIQHLEAWKASKHFTYFYEVSID